jgi:hypothetical protein
MVASTDPPGKIVLVPNTSEKDLCVAGVERLVPVEPCADQEVMVIALPCRWATFIV